MRLVLENMTLRGDENMYYIAICDDNAQFLETMEKTIERNQEYEGDMICLKFLNGEELLCTDVKQYHLIILDMQMDHMGGYAVAKKIREQNEDAVLAFCSGVIMPEPKHFEVQPYRYLLKKIDMDKMQKDVSDLLLEMKKRRKNRIIEVVSDGKAYRLNLKDIVYISRLKRGSVLIVEQASNENEKKYEEIKSNEKLEDWYPQLSNDGFEFAHTSYIVNMQKIVSIVKEDILMSNKQLLRISRTCKQKFHERFSYYFSKKYRRDTEK